MQFELGLEARSVLGSGSRWSLWLSWKQKAGNIGLGSGIYFERGQM